jgi:hypothetical protein
MAYLSLLLPVTLGSAVLVRIARREAAGMLWSVALAGGSADAVALLLDAHPYRESAPVGLVLMVLSPWVVAAAIAVAGRRDRWYLVWPLAAVVAVVVSVPSYLLGCVISDFLPVPGCFF